MTWTDQGNAESVEKCRNSSHVLMICEEAEDNHYNVHGVKANENLLGVLLKVLETGRKVKTGRVNQIKYGTSC